MQMAEGTPWASKRRRIRSSLAESLCAVTTVRLGGELGRSYSWGTYPKATCVQEEPSCVSRNSSIMNAYIRACTCARIHKFVLSMPTRVGVK